MTPVPRMTVDEALQEAARDPATHRPYQALGIVGRYCIADGEPWPCLREREAATCRCSHIQTHHVTDRRGRVVCRSAACGCAEFRPGGSK